MTSTAHQLPPPAAPPPAVTHAWAFGTWAQRLERARTALGMRPASIHVPPTHWARHYLAGLDPVSALLAEL